jgi:hypothetical protein
MKYTVTSMLCGCAGLLAASCGQAGPDDPWAGAEDGELASSEAALSGNLDFPGDHQCLVPNEMVRIARASSIARARLEDPRMLLCLREHGISGDSGIMREQILQRMLENKTTTIRCRTLPDNVGAEGAVGISGESVTFNHKVLGGNTSDVVLAGYLLHEVAHNKGFDHPTVVNRSDSAEYEFTVPEQLSICSQAISNGSFVADYGFGPVPNAKGPSHGELTRAARLAHVGGDGGLPFISRCSSNKYARGVSGAAAGRLDRVALACGDRNGIGVDFRSEYGGSGGTPFQEVCSEGQLMTGIIGYADSVVSGIQVRCKTPAEINAGNGGRWNDNWNGSETGYLYERHCPKGQAVRRILGRSSTLVDNIVLECEKLDLGSQQGSEWTPPAGLETGSNFEERCPIGTVMTVLTGSNDNNVARLGGVCQAVDRFGQGAGGTPHVRMKIGSEVGVLEAHGSFKGKAWTTTCGNTSEALIGFGVNLDGTNVERVWGVCAHAENWSDERNVAPSSHSTGAFGRDRGVITTRICPREYFLSGLETFVDANKVRQIEGICVRAEQ